MNSGGSGSSFRRKKQESAREMHTGAQQLAGPASGDGERSECLGPAEPAGRKDWRGSPQAGLPPALPLASPAVVYGLLCTFGEDQGKGRPKINNIFLDHQLYSTAKHLLFSVNTFILKPAQTFLERIQNACEFLIEKLESSRRFLAWETHFRHRPTCRPLRVKTQPSL